MTCRKKKFSLESRENQGICILLLTGHPVYSPIQQEASSPCGPGSNVSDFSTTVGSTCVQNPLPAVLTVFQGFPQFYQANTLSKALAIPARDTKRSQIQFIKGTRGSNAKPLRVFWSQTCIWTEHLSSVMQQQLKYWK